MVDELLESSHWTSVHANSKHSRLEITVLEVEAALPSFGYPFGEMKKSDAVVVLNSCGSDNVEIAEGGANIVEQ